MKQIFLNKLVWVGFATACMILAAQPLQWLFQSWISPSYGSYGYVYVGAILALAGRSFLSGPATIKRGRT